MSRRCLICANTNPCRLHSEEDQDKELRMNVAAIQNIERGGVVGLVNPASTAVRVIITEALEDRKA